MRSFDPESPKPKEKRYQEHSLLTGNVAASWKLLKNKYILNSSPDPPDPPQIGRKWPELAARNPQRTTQRSNREPLDKKRREQDKDNKQTPQIRSLFTTVLRSSPSGGLFWRRRGAKKTHTYICLQFWTPGGAKMGPNLMFYHDFEHTPVATKAFRTYFHRVLRSGVPSAARRQQQTRSNYGLKVAGTLGWLLGPRGPPRGGPERPRNPQGNAKHEGGVDFWKSNEKQDV